MNISHTYPRPHRQTAGRAIDGEAVLMLADTSMINVLNRVGSRIYELSDGTRSVAEIIDIVVDENEVEPEVARADVIEFLKQLVKDEVMTLEQRS